MELPESSEKVEAALKRLMPPALSERGQRRLEEALGGMAAGGAGAAGVAAAKSSWWPWLVGMPAAAAVAFVAALSIDDPPAAAPGSEMATTTAPEKTTVAPREEDFVDVPMKVLEPAKRRAEFQWKGEKLEVVCLGPDARILWYGAGGELKFDGSPGEPGLPDFWQQRAAALEADLRARMAAEPVPVE